MKQYIDKTALMMEIERRLEALANTSAGNNREFAAIIGAQHYELINLVQFINTLKVKEVKQEDKELEVWKPIPNYEENLKQLLLKDLCARLPYGVKILHTGWDYDSDTNFDTVETLIGIDDRFIYTIWDKTGDREKHCLSVSNWKPYLRPMSSMTEEERNYYNDRWFEGYHTKHGDDMVSEPEIPSYIDWLNAHHFDYRGLIEKNLALDCTELHIYD